ncbi:hypothetical protein [Roseateles sp.]|uniref:hypothetical protein n=1 Tax=Roseateles sp. TaxID=1971397 RepID=UPI00286B071E|nr:hypothetical protein [Roseateles sp.]
MNSHSIATRTNALAPGPPCRFFGFPELLRLGRDYLGHLSGLQRRQRRGQAGRERRAGLE